MLASLGGRNPIMGNRTIGCREASYRPAQRYKHAYAGPQVRSVDYQWADRLESSHAVEAGGLGQAIDFSEVVEGSVRIDAVHPD